MTAHYSVSENILKQASLPFDMLGEDSRSITIHDSNSGVTIRTQEHIACACSNLLAAMVQMDRHQTEYVIHLPRPECAEQILTYLKVGTFTTMVVHRENFVPLLVNANYLQMERAFRGLQYIFLEYADDIQRSQSFKRGELTGNLLMSCFGTFSTQALVSYLRYKDNTGRSVLKNWFKTQDPDTLGPPMKMVNALLDDDIRSISLPVLKAVKKLLNSKWERVREPKDKYYRIPADLVRDVKAQVDKALRVADKQ